MFPREPAFAAPGQVPGAGILREDTPKFGDHLRVVPVGDNSRQYEAEVKLLSPTIDPASMSYDVTAQLTGPDLGQLRPGMAVKVLWPARNQPTGP